MTSRSTQLIVAIAAAAAAAVIAVGRKDSMMNRNFDSPGMVESYAPNVNTEHNSSFDGTYA